MALKLYSVVSKFAKFNTLLGHAQRKVYLNTAQKARSNSTVAWPPPNLLKNYQKFQVNDGVPVYLKGGFGDRILFGLTVGLSFIGLGDGLYTIYGMAFPKKRA